MSESPSEESYEDLELSDNEFISRERLRSITKWYGRVLEREDEIERARVQGGINNNQADILYKATVTQYVQDAVKTLQGNGFSEYIYPNEGNYDLGTVTIPAPTPYEVAWREARPPERIGPKPPSNPDTMPPKYDVVNDDGLENRTYRIVGLMGFTDAPPEFSELYEVEIQGPTGKSTHQMSVTQPMPRQISREAFRVTNSLLNQLDIDIELDAHQHGQT